MPTAHAGNFSRQTNLPPKTPQQISGDKRTSRNSTAKPVVLENVHLRRRDTTVSAKELAVMRATFDKFDVDKSGNIDGNELREVMRFLGYEITEEESHALLRQIDVNGNGTVDFDEFAQLLRLYKEAAQFKLMQDEGAGSANDSKMRKARTQHNYPTDAPYVVLWHIFVLVIVVYYVIAPLYFDTVSLQECYDFTRKSMAWDIIVTLVFAADIVLSLKVSTMRFDIRTIQYHYLVTWFPLDLLALFPLQLFTEDKVAVRVLYHMRMAKVFRGFIVYFTPSGRLEANRRYVYLHFYIIPIVRVLLFYIAFIHSAAVAYFFVRTEASQDASFTYLESLYFVAYSVTGVGFGTIVTTSGVERMYASFLCLCAQVFSAIIVANVVKIVSQSDVTTKKQHKAKFMMEISNLYDFPLALRDEVLGFQEHLEEDSLSASYRDLIENLPSLLQSNIVLFVKMRIIAQSSLFRNAHRATQVSIAEELESRVCKPGEAIFHIGDERTDMYFVVYGFVSMLSEQGQILLTIKQGEHFGEEGMLTGYSEKTYVARSETYSELFVLTRFAFRAVLKQFPRFRQEMQKLAAEHVKKRNASVASATGLGLTTNKRKKSGALLGGAGAGVGSIGGKKGSTLSKVSIVQSVKGEDESTSGKSTRQNSFAARPSVDHSPSFRANEILKRMDNLSSSPDVLGHSAEAGVVNPLAPPGEDAVESLFGDDASELESSNGARIKRVDSGIGELDSIDDEESDFLAEALSKVAVVRAGENAGGGARSQSEEDEILFKCAVEMAEIEDIVAALEGYGYAKLHGIPLKDFNISDFTPNRDQLAAVSSESVVQVVSPTSTPRVPVVSPPNVAATHSPTLEEHKLAPEQSLYEFAPLSKKDSWPTAQVPSIRVESRSVSPAFPRRAQAVQSQTGSSGDDSPGATTILTAAAPPSTQPATSPTARASPNGQHNSPPPSNSQDTTPRAAGQQQRDSFNLGSDAAGNQLRPNSASGVSENESTGGEKNNPDRPPRQDSAESSFGSNDGGETGPA